MTNRRIVRWTKEPTVDFVKGCKALRDNSRLEIARTSGLVCDEHEDTANAILFAFAGEMWELINGLCMVGDRTELINKINRTYAAALKGQSHGASEEA